MVKRKHRKKKSCMQISAWIKEERKHPVISRIGFLFFCVRIIPGNQEAIMEDNQENNKNASNQTFSWENKESSESRTEPLNLDELREVIAEIRY
jgi:hypothetical protein